MEAFNGTATVGPSFKATEVRPLQAIILIATSLLASMSTVHALREIKQVGGSILHKPLLALGILASIVLYCYVADRTTIFYQITKRSDELAFLTCCILALIFGLASTRSCEHKEMVPETDQTIRVELLSRHQTEEWKGWMQIAILLYHYFGMSKVLHIYRIIRVLVGSYLFMTGYGHTIYFLRTNDFSCRRAAAVLIRLNLLACLLPLTMGTRYDLYYFPTLSSFWFLITWITIPRTATFAKNLRPVIYRIFAACFVTEILLLAPGLWGYFAAWLRSAKMVDLNSDELVFRLSLDRYITYVGMLTACANEHYRETAAFSSSLRLLNRRTLAISLCIFCVYLITSSASTSKEASNRAHAFTEAIPILMFVLIRNATPSLRRYQCQLFCWVGRYSLETFLLQYHIWLAADAKKLLSLRAPATSLHTHDTRSIRLWLEWSLLTSLFLFASYLAGNATSTITLWMVGPKKTGSLLDNVVVRKFPDAPCSMKERTRAALALGIRQKLLLLLVLLWLLKAMW